MAEAPYINEVLGTSCSEQPRPSLQLPTAINPEKLKVAELHNWLKANNIPYHHSWKKLHLVQKVKDAIADGVQPPIPKTATKASRKISYPAMGTGWGKDLRNISVSIDMVDEYVAQHNTSLFSRKDLSAPSVKLKAFKFAVEGYCTNILTYNGENIVYCSTRCYHSFRKNEKPHIVKCTLKNSQVINGECTCSAGEGGHCNHVLALLYSLCTFTEQKLTVVPDDITCTSMLQKWHKPRGTDINPEPTDVLVVKKICMKDGGAVARHETKGIHSTLYKAAKLPLLHDPDVVCQAKKELNNINPRIPAAYMLNPSSDSTVYTKTKFGSVEKGCLLSYQYRSEDPVTFPTVSNIAPCQNPCPQPLVYPTFPLVPIPPYVSSSLEILAASEMSNDLFESIILTENEASSLEVRTREQSECDLWVSARKHRLTASLFGQVKRASCKQGNKSKESLLKKKLQPVKHSGFVKNMLQYGLDMEPAIADKYCKHMHSIGHGVAVSTCGLVVNENNAWLAATPDRKVVDMAEDFPFGLLEMKAPAHPTYKNVTPLETCNSATFYLENKNGFPSLKKDHERGYYEQVQGQMAVTGAQWCDFVVCTQKGMSVERIRYDKEVWLDTVKYLESFYIDYFIPAIVNAESTC